MHDRPTCGARNRAGRPCGRSPRPNGRCHLHGGASLGGVLSPRFKHGRYSKYPLARLVGERLNPEAWAPEREKRARAAARGLRAAAARLAGHYRAKGRPIAAAFCEDVATGRRVVTT